MNVQANTMPKRSAWRGPLMLALLGSTLMGCSKNFDWDMRSIFNGFDTSDAAQNTQARPTPDANGIIAYPTYRVVMARKGETPSSIAQRLGIDANTLASTNGISPDSVLRDGELLTLPADAQTETTNTALPQGTAPRRHEVRSGETAYSIARLYDVPVQSLAALNNLDDALSIRSGQTILIPVVGTTTTSEATSTPGAGSATPTPPSSTQPLPKDAPAPLPTASASTPSAPVPAPAPAPQAAPDLSTTASATPQKSARMVMPMSGPIVREYSKGRNDGIDIGGSAGASIKAAASGTVAAITENTNGAKVVVIRHSDGLLTVYVNLSDMKVAQGASVSKGQTIGSLASGASSLHFEVRRGLESVNPNDFLPS